MGNKYIGKNDSYEKFLGELSLDRVDFIKWGINSIIYVPEERIQDVWDRIKKEKYWQGTQKEGKKQKSFIRGYGRNASGTKYFIELNKKILEVVSGVKDANVVPDSSNNSKPIALLKELTRFERNGASNGRTPIYNYQVSHIFGRTKNVLLFTAPWNVCYTPKIIDPLTGHETYRDSIIVKDFKCKWAEEVFNKFSIYIKQYNEIINKNEVRQVIDNYKNEVRELKELDEKKKTQIIKDIDNAFSEITKDCVYVDEAEDSEE